MPIINFDTNKINPQCLSLLQHIMLTSDIVNDKDGNCDSIKRISAFLYTRENIELLNSITNFLDCNIEIKKIKCLLRIFTNPLPITIDDYKCNINWKLLQEKQPRITSIREKQYITKCGSSMAFNIVEMIDMPDNEEYLIFGDDIKHIINSIFENQWPIIVKSMTYSVCCGPIIEFAADISFIIATKNSDN